MLEKIKFSHQGNKSEAKVKIDPVHNEDVVLDYKRVEQLRVGNIVDA